MTELPFEVTGNLEFKERVGVIFPGTIIVSNEDVISEAAPENLVLHQSGKIEMGTTFPRRVVNLHQKGDFLGLSLRSGLAQIGLNIKSLEVNSVTAEANVILENLNPDILTLRAGERIKIGRPYIRSGEPLGDKELEEVKTGIKCRRHDCLEIIEFPDISSDLLLAIPLAKRILPQEHSQSQVNLASLARGTERERLHKQMGFDTNRDRHDSYFDDHNLSLASTDKLTLPEDRDLFIVGVRNKKTGQLFQHGASSLLFSQSPDGKIYHHERIVEILAPPSYLATEDINNFQVLCLAYRHQA